MNHPDGEVAATLVNSEVKRAGKVRLLVIRIGDLFIGPQYTYFYDFIETQAAMRVKKNFEVGMV